MLDGVLKLNKLSRGLFLSWSVNAVILGAGAAKSNAQKPHRGIQLSLYLPHPARHTLSLPSFFYSLTHMHPSLRTYSPHPSTSICSHFICFPFLSLLFLLPAFHMVKASFLCQSILLITEFSMGTPLRSIVINNNRALNKTGRGNK